MNYGYDNQITKCPETLQGQCVNPTLTQSLELRKELLERELAQVVEALTALKAYPEVEKVLNLVQKIR